MSSRTCLRLAMLLSAAACTELKPGEEIAGGSTAADAGARQDGGAGADVDPLADAEPQVPDSGLVPDGGVACVAELGQPCTLPNLCGATVACDGSCTGGTAPIACPCGDPACMGNTWICTGACCDPLTGQGCTRDGYCGAVYDCDAQCVGGTAEPSCSCDTLSCDTSTGRWSTCSDPPFIGQRCGDSQSCGGTVRCDGSCQGGAPPPPCPCGQLSCDVPSGQWSACPGSPSTGQPCDVMNRCGATVACDGSCQGGAQRPPCSCAMQSCDLQTGQWSACPDPMGLGQPCSTADTCGGTLACDGSCQGGAARPPCTCNAPICNPASGQWSGCTDPPDLGAMCDGNGRCGGNVSCNGQCTGGNPLPSCPQCGAPTCSGCTGGVCGPSSTCDANGSCVCTVNECTCGSPGSGCLTCLGNDLGGCAEDPYGCGAFTAGTTCAFGCGGSPPTCQCSPDTGNYCVAGLCTCVCGDIDRDGEVQCDGSCLPTINCGPLCRDLCGPPR